MRSNSIIDRQTFGILRYCQSLFNTLPSEAVSKRTTITFTEALRPQSSFIQFLLLIEEIKVKLSNLEVADIAI